MLSFFANSLNLKDSYKILSQNFLYLKDVEINNNNNLSLYSDILKGFSLNLETIHDGNITDSKNRGDLLSGVTIKEKFEVIINI